MVFNVVGRLRPSPEQAGYPVVHSLRGLKPLRQRFGVIDANVFPCATFFLGRAPCVFVAPLARGDKNKGRLLFIHAISLRQAFFEIRLGFALIVLFDAQLPHTQTLRHKRVALRCRDYAIPTRTLNAFVGGKIHFYQMRRVHGGVNEAAQNNRQGVSGFNPVGPLLEVNRPIPR